ncbi:quaternary amine ABC transporter ATP-binding protein [Oceanobacillus sp. CAU 1775]
MTTKVKIQHVTKIFGPRPKETLQFLEGDISREAFAEKTGHSIGIRDVSLDVKEGEIFVIMGLSGSGKSTLLRCLNLLNEPTAGKIIIDGEEITAYNDQQLKHFRQNKIAMVFQNFGLFSHRTVAENVGYGLEIRKVPIKERDRLIQESIETVGLKGTEDKYPAELSGGMQQRVGLARALANDPDILLMDEPFSALDPLIRRQMQEELLDLQKKLKKTIIFITHDVNEAFKIGNRVAVMKNGQIEQINTPLHILREPANTYIEEFVKDIDRAKVLQVKDIMGELKIFSEAELKQYLARENKIDASLYLQDVLEVALASSTSLVVVEDDEFVGLLSKEEILKSLI